MPDCTLPAISQFAKPSRVKRHREYAQRCFMCGTHDRRAYAISPIGPVCLGCVAVCVELVVTQCEGMRA